MLKPRIAIFALLGVCVFAIPSASASEDPVPTNSTAAPPESSEEVPFTNTTLEHEEEPECEPVFAEPIPEASKKYIAVCYATEAKASRLIDKISWTVRILATAGTTLYNDEQQLKNDTSMRQIVSVCSNRRVESLIEDIGEVAHRLWVLSIRLQEPCDSDKYKVDKMKVELIRRLQAIRVYSTKSALSPHPMLLQSYDALVDELEYVFNAALVMFQTPRPTRPPFDPAPLLRKGHGDSMIYNDPVIQSILQPNNSVSDLIELARDHPKSMTSALPQLVSNWYAGNLTRFDQLLQFVTRLPTLVQQIIANGEIYNQLRLHSHLETFELTQLAVQVHRLNTSVAATSETIPLSFHAKLGNLAKDMGPIYGFIGRTSTCYLRNVAYSRIFAMKSSYPLKGFLHPTVDDYGWLLAISSSNGDSIFRITYSSTYPLYALQDNIYDSKRRHLLLRPSSDVPSTAFYDWKLIPAQGGKYFRLLNAKYDEVAFADKTLMDGNNRHVFLARKDHSGDYGFEPKADLWNFECT